MVADLNKQYLLKALSGPLPGEKAQQQMAPDFRGKFLHSDDPGIAAVMILIFPYPDKDHTLFIKRNEYPGPHSGQVSFPGGLFESKDISLEQTALRETLEETGIDKNIEVLGSLTPLYIPVSNIVVTPFVGLVETSPTFNPDPAEVQYLIEVPVSELFNRRKIMQEKIKRHDIEIMAPFYMLNNEKVWGATAMMLSEFIALAGQMPGPQY